MEMKLSIKGDIKSNLWYILHIFHLPKEFNCIRLETQIQPSFA